jgi:hypothetical protein
MKLSLDSPMCVRFASVAGVSIILLRVWRIWAAGGLFFTLGLDYAIYGAAAEAVTRSGWSSLYDPEANTRAFAGWIAEDPGSRIDPSRYVASPYPAPFLVPFLATNLLGHGGGFVAWTLLNVLVYAVIVRGLARGSERSGPLINLAPFAFFPFLWTLYLGQLVIVMAFGLYRALRAFEKGRELAAGCWLGLLLLKPQFGLILAGILLVKRRWAALGGLGLAAAGMAAATFALVGVDGVRGFLGILRSFSGFRRVPDIVNPLDMINFRGALAHLLPETWSEEQGTRAVLVLSAAITLCLVPIWRGPWDPRVSRFPRQILATMIVALFASFHTHVHAATLLIVPMLAALRTRREPDPLLNLLSLLIFLPTFSVASDGIIEHCSWILMALMALILGVILAESRRPPRGALHRVARPSPMARVAAPAYNGRV